MAKQWIESNKITITGGSDTNNEQLNEWLMANATLVEPISLQKTTLCMKRAVPGGEVTDLTGTTWEFSTSINVLIFTSTTFTFNFNSNDTNYTSLIIGDWTSFRTSTLDYNNDNVYNEIDGGWQNNVYKTITITGGTDATNSDLIAFLQVNATLVSGGPVIYRMVPVSIMQKIIGGTITDLTGTTWTLNDTWTLLPNGSSVENYDGSMFGAELNFTSNNTDFSYIELFDRDYNEFLAYRQSSSSPISIVDYSWNWTNNAYKTIQITGGTAATNSDLIAWLQENATLDSGGVSLQPLAIGYTSEASTGGTFTISWTDDGGTIFSGLSFDFTDENDVILDSFEEGDNVYDLSIISNDIIKIAFSYGVSSASFAHNNIESDDATVSLETTYSGSGVHRRRTDTYTISNISDGTVIEIHTYAS